MLRLGIMNAVRCKNCQIRTLPVWSPRIARSPWDFLFLRIVRWIVDLNADLRFIVGIVVCKSIVGSIVRAPYENGAIAIQWQYGRRTILWQFAPPKKSHDARAIPTITVRAPHDVHTVASQCSYDIYNPTVIVQAPYCARTSPTIGLF